MPAHRRNIVTLGSTLLIAALLSSAGCRIGESDVELWKGTVKGPSKMVAVLLADRYDIDLRTKAALALIQMERKDVDGVEELKKALSKLDDKTQEKVIDGIADGLISQMQQQTEAKEGEEGKSASQSQIRAKDAAFTLVKKASPQTRDKLTRAIVDWFAVDFNGRNLAGNYSAEQVLRELGSGATGQLVEALDAKMPPQALLKLSQLIGETATDATRKAAAEKLVAIEKELESPKFYNWLKEKITAQSKESGDKLTPQRIELAAAQNRETFITTGAIPAMKFLASEKAVGSRLLDIASNPATDPVMLARRTMALLALEGKATEEYHDRLMQLALDEKNPPEIRDNAFDRLGDIRSPKTIPRLWPLVQSSTDQRLRWRAGELVLAIGGTKTLDEFLRRLPPSTKYEPEELEGYATRIGQISPLPTTQMEALLRSPEWHKRVIALRFFERKGSLEDLAKLKALASDKTPVSGEHWDANSNVGTVATSAIEGLKQRLDEPKKES